MMQKICTQKLRLMHTTIMLMWKKCRTGMFGASFSLLLDLELSCQVNSFYYSIVNRNCSEDMFPLSKKLLYNYVIKLQEEDNEQKKG